MLQVDKEEMLPVLTTISADRFHYIGLVGVGLYYKSG